jgi:hypothetical protein
MMRPCVTVALQQLAIPMLRRRGWCQSVFWSLANETWRSLREEGWELGVHAESIFEQVLKLAAETMGLFNCGLLVDVHKMVESCVCDAVKEWKAISELRVRNVSVSDVIDEIVRDLGPKPQWEQMLRAKFQVPA